MCHIVCDDIIIDVAETFAGSSLQVIDKIVISAEPVYSHVECKAGKRVELLLIGFDPVFTEEFIDSRCYFVIDCLDKESIRFGGCHAVVEIISCSQCTAVSYCQMAGNDGIINGIFSKTFLITYEINSFFACTVVFKI